MNFRDAAEPLVLNMGGLRLGVITIAERDFCVTAEDECSANPLDMRRFVRSVGENSHRWDYLLVLIHSGLEHYPYPTQDVLQAAPDGMRVKSVKSGDTSSNDYCKA